ncbi:MAG TPA: hypothetical protein VN641_20505 [Urbifossiella sp.]|nr:hypothetical protein [Urbifossiella sp.]
MSEPVPPEAEGETAAPWESKPTKPSGTAPSGAGAFGWHESTKGKGKRTQVALVVALFFGLLGLLIGLFFYIRTPARDVELWTIPISQYRHIEWDANPTADRDAGELLTQFRQAGGLGSAYQEVESLRKLLADLHERKDSEARLIVFVSALGIVRDGRVYILPGDAVLHGVPAEAAKTWVPLADLLQSVDACAATEKALILDIARSPADPFRGPLSDDVAAQIDKELKAFQPKFPVLASCSPGEKSLVIPELGQSAFAAFLTEGLRGDADGYPPSQEPDGSITFAELAGFTICRVSRWADQVPDARQMPVLYGPDGSGFILFRGRPRSAAPEETEPPAIPNMPYPAELLAAWKVRDDARGILGLVLAPDLILELEAMLLRAEERFLDGLPVDDPRADVSWRTAASRLKKRTTLFDAAPAIRATLVDYRAGRGEPAKELTDAIDKWMKLRFPLPDATGKVTPADPAAVGKAGEELDKVLVNSAAAVDGFAHLWSRLTSDTGLSREKLTTVSAAIEEDRFLKLPLTSEQLLLRRLSQVKLPDAAFPQAMLALLKAEEAWSARVAMTAGRLPQGFRAVQALLNEGNALKQAGERRLLTPRLDPDEIAATQQQLASATQKLKDARSGASVIRDARIAWAEAGWRLHAALPGIIASERPASRDWFDAAEIAAKLAAAFNGKQIDFEAMDGLTRRLRGALAKLPLANADRIKALTKEAQERPQAASYTELLALLSGPALAADERAAVASAFRKVSAQRYQAARAKFDREQTRVPIDHAKGEDPLRRTQRRTRASIDLLRLAGFADVPALEDAARNNSNDPAKWQSLADRLNAAWASPFPKSDPTAAMERVVRAAPARLAGFDPERGFGELFRTEEAERRKWLAARFAEYGKLRASVPGAAEFYRDLAAECDRPLPKAAQ